MKLDKYSAINSRPQDLEKIKVSCKIVALGNKASQRLNKLNISHFKLPHPSGRNRKLNDPKFIKKTLNECYKWLNCEI